MSFAGSASIELDARRLREAFSSGLADALPLLVGYLDRDARYLFVNRAYEAWFKRDRDQIEGRPMAQVLGDAAFARIKPFIDRVLTGELVIYRGEMAQDLAGFRHVEARFTPDAAADGAVRGFYLTVQEIPARQASDPELGHLLHRERRRVALLDLGRQLREEIDPQAVALLACGVLAQQLAAPRVGYAQVDAQHRNAAIIGEWAAPGFPSLLGADRELDAFGPEMSAELRAGRAIVCPDVAGDPRGFSPAALAAYAALRIGAFLTCPLIKGRRMAAYVYLCQDAPRAWSSDEIAFVADVAELVWSATDRASAEAALKQAEETERLLIREVDHRAKNVLAVVQSLAKLTPFETKSQYVEALSGRIGSLARSHSLLSTSRWTGVRLDVLLRQELEAYDFGDENRVHIDGPPVLIQAEAAQSLGLVVHELATNASKYGALSEVTGALSVTWAWDAEHRLVLLWRETSARTVKPPSRRGFGSTLITQVTRQLGAQIQKDWEPKGLNCRLELLKGAQPCDAAASAANLGALGRPQPGVETLRDQRVLIVEDEVLVAMDLARVLTQAGALVVGPAGSVEDALALVALGAFDRAILDVNLGGRMVTPVATALSERGIPFVYLTGYQEPRVEGGPVLHKPASLEKLLAVLGG
ncbi:MAG: PAS domain-containing protein [Alphaproteobacteria bacterium]|nr:PAS domain-containing protein [Alphaproteobacteria bacterium]